MNNKKLIPFSKIYPNEFLSRTEDNFPILLEKLTLFYEKTRIDIGDGKVSRRKADGRFSYEKELKDVQLNEIGISSEEAITELNEMFKGCMRPTDPICAFNIAPSPLFDIIAGMTLMSLYTPNVCWDFASGKFCLFEKKIVKILGQLINWEEAEGLVATGGKQTLMYAIKNGMQRASRGVHANLNDFVVITSNLAHYSIEHVCHYLGIPAKNCLRISSDDLGEIDLKALEDTLCNVISENKKIAAVIAVAGATINLVPDPIEAIKNTLNKVSYRYELDYIPYLHVDSVISWVWLVFANDEETSWRKNHSSEVAEKIDHVLLKLKGIRHADSFAADFHKTGFCPYAASVFITKESKDLAGMSLDESTPKKEIYFGEAETYRFSMENSRSGLPVVSIWIALRRMGLEGMRRFVLYQLDVCEVFKEAIRTQYREHFEIINEHTNGWEIVLKMHFNDQMLWDELQNAPKETQQEYIDTCFKFLNYFWYSSLESEINQMPVLGFVKAYSRKGDHEKKFPAFLIHPTSLHYDEGAIGDMLECIATAKIKFENQYQEQYCAASITEYFYKGTPPR